MPKASGFYIFRFFALRTIDAYAFGFSVCPSARIWDCKQSRITRLTDYSASMSASSISALW